jgi:hypothetical protein
MAKSQRPVVMDKVSSNVIAWKLQKIHSGSVSILQKYITFVKDNLARIAQKAIHVE